MNNTAKPNGHCVKQPENAKLDEIAARKANKHLRLIQAPADCNAQSSKSTPRRPKNEDVRSREYLTEDEVKKLREAAKRTGRNGQRDQLIILMMYRHGLRVSELIDLQWDQVSFTDGAIHIRRIKNGKDSVHALEGDEMRVLRKLKRDAVSAKWIFTSERKGTLSARAIQTMIKRAGEVAGLDMPVHPHMLRHAAGYNLAKAGATTRDIQGFLGHANIQNTVIYTQLAPNRFKSFGELLGD